MQCFLSSTDRNVNSNDKIVILMLIVDFFNSFSCKLLP